MAFVRALSALIFRERRQDQVFAALADENSLIKEPLQVGDLNANTLEAQHARRIAAESIFQNRSLARFEAARILRGSDGFSRRDRRMIGENGEGHAGGTRMDDFHPHLELDASPHHRHFSTHLKTPGARYGAA